MTKKEKAELAIAACLILSTAVNVYLKYGRNVSPTRSARAGEYLPPLRSSSLVSGDLPPRPSNRSTLYYWFSPECHFCRENQESAAKLAASLPAGQFVGISAADGSLKDYIESEHIAFPVLALPPAAETLAKFGETPTTFLVSADGVIEKVWAGAYVDRTRQDLERYFKVSLPPLTFAARKSTTPPAVVRSR